MLGRMAGGATEQREAPFESPSLAPPKLFLAAGSGVGSSPVAAEAAAAMSPTSTLQAAAGSPTSPAAAAVPFSRRRGAGSPPPGGDRRCHLPAWEARPAGLGLAVAGALNGDAAPPAATVLTGPGFRSPALAAADRSARSSNSSTSRGRRPWLMSPGEMEASEDYTRVIAREGPHPRTTHIFDDRGFSVGGVGEDDAFLSRCHGCSKDLGQGKDIFMYRGEMAFCSHECRYREMLLFDEES